MELRWVCTAPDWSLDYWSRRELKAGLGSFFRQDVLGLRTARLTFQGVEPNSVRISLADIVDDAVVKGGGSHQRSLGTQVYPLLSLDLDGTISKNFYPGNLTFPLIWVPLLVRLSPGQPRRTQVSLRLKSGFRRAVTSGFVETTLREVEGPTVEQYTRFELDSAPKGLVLRPDSNKIPGPESLFIRQGVGPDDFGRSNLRIAAVVASVPFS